MLAPSPPTRIQIVQNEAFSIAIQTNDEASPFSEAATPTTTESTQQPTVPPLPMSQRNFANAVTEEGPKGFSDEGNNMHQQPSLWACNRVESLEVLIRRALTESENGDNSSTKSISGSDSDTLLFALASSDPLSGLFGNASLHTLRLVFPRHLSTVSAAGMDEREGVYFPCGEPDAFNYAFIFTILSAEVENWSGPQTPAPHPPLHEVPPTLVAGERPERLTQRFASVRRDPDLLLVDRCGERVLIKGEEGSSVGRPSEWGDARRTSALLGPIGGFVRPSDLLSGAAPQLALAFNGSIVTAGYSSSQNEEADALGTPRSGLAAVVEDCTSPAAVVPFVPIFPTAPITPSAELSVSLSAALSVASPSAHPSASATSELFASPSLENSSTLTIPRRLLRLIPPPDKIKDTAAALQQVSGGVVSVVAVAGGVTGAGQLGVANALTRLASCTEDDGDDDETLPILVHPLQFSFYSTGGGDGLRGAYAASVISNTIIISSLHSISTGRAAAPPASSTPS